MKNVSFKLTQDSLLAHIRKQGFQAERAVIASDKKTGKPRGFAFVDFVDENEAKRALEVLSNQELEGRQIIASLAETRVLEPRKIQQVSPNETLFLSNLPLKTSILDISAKLQEIFDMFNASHS
jgi:RNA recognition motif-containing protein